MAKAGRGQTRRDSKRRVLRPGESVRADGKYQCTDAQYYPHVCRHTYCSNMAKSGMNNIFCRTATFYLNDSKMEYIQLFGKAIELMKNSRKY